MGHTAEDVPRFVQRSAPRMKTSCYSAILNKALAFSKLPALAVRIAAPRQAASWGAQAGKGPRPARGPLPRPAQHRRDGRSFLYRNGHGRRPHPVALMARFHAEEDRRARGGIAPAQTSGDLPFQSVVATCSAGRRSVMRPGSRKNRLARESALFFQRRKDGALSCPDCALVRNPFYLMEIIDFWDRGVKTTPRLRDKGRILAAGRPAHIRLAGL